MIRKKITAAVIASTALTLSACSGKTMTIPEADTAAAKLFETRCATCHSLPHPARNSASEWPGILALMDRRMRERHVPPLDDAERETLLRYLQTHARD